MKREMFFKSQHITAIGIFGVVMVLVMRSHACGRGSGGDEKTTSKPTTQATTEVQKSKKPRREPKICCLVQLLATYFTQLIFCVLHEMSFAEFLYTFINFSRLSN